VTPREAKKDAMSDHAKRLTDYANCAGCAGKIAPSGVMALLRALPPRAPDPNVLVGTETFDDAGVFRLADGLAIVQTLDFFPPLVDDPFTFGQIAAANALSDVYAMNARPVTAMNIVGFPDDELPLEILIEILKGGADRVAQSGAALVGGHSLRDTGIKFGLSVTGVVDPAEMLTNASGRPGDVLVLTKPLGTGFVTTAAKKGECPPAVLERAIASMIQLNAVGRDSLRAAGGAHAVTDVTGYGLAGHASEMADGAGVTVEIDLAALPLITGSEPLATSRYSSRASITNRAYVEERLQVNPAADPMRLAYAFDAQTSGGLLIAVDPGHADRLVAELRSAGALAAAKIGRLTERQGRIAVILK
jgi:selenide, water dikinase